MTEPPPRAALSELSASEARPVFERFVAERPMRLAAFVEDVRRSGGPADSLDRSLDSLDAIWLWFLDQAPRAAAADDASMPAAGAPWWYEFHPAWGLALGPELAAVATGLSDYFFECLLEHVPAAEWRMSSRSATRRHPVLAIPNRGEVVYTAPLGLAVNAARDSIHADRRPNALRRLAEVWLGLDPEHEALAASIARPLPPYAVDAAEGGRFTHVLSFGEAVAHRQAGRIRRVVESLAAEPAIEDVIREDREVVLIRAPYSSTAEVEAIVAHAWDSAPHGGLASDVP
jgi:plasmid stabilization system protein ParE